jgi:UrcA family protein
MKTQIALAAVTLVVAFAGGAYAQQAPQLHVKYGDLNISTTAGANVLYRRIRAAAVQVCGVPDHRELARSAQAEACTARAVADAVAKVDAPALTRTYLRETGRTSDTRLAVAR